MRQVEYFKKDNLIIFNRIVKQDDLYGFIVNTYEYPWGDHGLLEAWKMGLTDK